MANNYYNNSWRNDQFQQFGSDPFETPWNQSISAQDMLFGGLNQELQRGAMVQPQTQPNAMMGRPETPNTLVQRGLEPVTREQVDAAYAAANQAPFGLPQTTPGVAFDTSAGEAADRKEHMENYVAGQYADRQDNLQPLTSPSAWRDNMRQTSAREEALNEQAKQVRGSLQSPVEAPTSASVVDGYVGAAQSYEDATQRLVGSGYTPQAAQQIAMAGPEAVQKAMDDRADNIGRMNLAPKANTYTIGQGINRDEAGTPLVQDLPAPVDATPPTTEDRVVRNAYAGIQPDANGIRTIPADMNMVKDAYEIRDYKTTDSGALWQGLLAGGIALIGAKLTKMDATESRQLFALAFANRFGTALNMSYRADSVEGLQKEGYTNLSIEQYIETGDRSVLTKREVSPWEERKDGTFMRRMPDGSMQLWGDPKPDRKAVSFSDGDYVRNAVWDNNAGDYVRDGKGNIIFEGGATLSQAAATRQAAAARQAPRNVVRVDYMDRGGKNYEVTLYSDGSTMEKEVAAKPMSATEMRLEAAKGAKSDLASKTWASAKESSDGITKLLASDLDLVTGNMSYLPSVGQADRREVENMFSQVFGRQFLDNVASMRGLGALSNAEGAKIANAASALVVTDRDGNATLRSGLSKEFVEKELRDIQQSYLNMMKIQEFAQEHGREPTIEELKAGAGTANPTQGLDPSQVKITRR